MRLAQLEMEGFASYQMPTEIDFDGLHLVAIVGNTGSGKSSVLDAINFAVWGKTRGGGIDTIVNTKSSEAKVRFTFELGGTLYRVSRVRSLGKNTGVTFEVGVEEDEALVWEPVGDGLVRGTDDEIRRVLGMNYDTFVATVFLGQGDADRFTADATPKARKEILADILGLDAYGLVAKAANEEARRLKATGAAIVAQADEIDTQLANKVVVVGELAEAKANCVGLQARLRGAQDRASALQQEVAALDARKDRIAQLNKDVATLRGKRAEERQRTERLVSTAANAVERWQREKGKASQRLADALAAASAATSLAGRRGSVAVQKASADEALARVTNEEVTIKGELVALKGEIPNIEGRLQETDTHLDAVSADSTSAVCYTCGQEVNTERRAALIGALAAESRDLEARLGKLRFQLAEMEARRSAKLAEHSAAKERVAKLDADLNGLVRAYEQAAAKAAGQGAAEDDGADIDKQLLEAEEHLGVAKKALEDLGGDDPAEAVLVAQVAENEVLLAGGASTREALEQARSQARAVEQVLQEATREQGAMEAKVAHYDELETKLADLRAQGDQLLEDIKVQEHLATAFGRDGIPAMILNSVVVELDSVVNDVLARLSEGTLGVRIETQREKKTGGVADTLEVIVSDGVTDRPYATFSGGERFKIDLALRVGLAKLLSRRSGTPIRTLAIDEGWGALDPDGVQAMIECLHALAADFDCLITISHVPAVADGFATRLVVTKTPFGSAIEVCV